MSSLTVGRRSRVLSPEIRRECCHPGGPTGQAEPCSNRVESDPDGSGRSLDWGYWVNESLYPKTDVIENSCGTKGLDGWFNGESQPNSASIVVNKTNAPISCETTSTVVVPVQTANVDPESYPSVSVIWTYTGKKTAGYTVAGDFTGDDRDEVSPSVQVDHNNETIHSNTISAYQQVDSFSLNVSPSPGNTITFYSDWGADVDQSFDGASGHDHERLSLHNIVSPMWASACGSWPVRSRLTGPATQPRTEKDAPATAASITDGMPPVTVPIWIDTRRDIPSQPLSLIDPFEDQMLARNELDRANELPSASGMTIQLPLKNRRLRHRIKALDLEAELIGQCHMGSHFRLDRRNAQPHSSIDWKGRGVKNRLSDVCPTQVIW